MSFVIDLYQVCVLSLLITVCGLSHSYLNGINAITFANDAFAFANTSATLYGVPVILGVGNLLCAARVGGLAQQTFGQTHLSVCQVAVVLSQHMTELADCCSTQQAFVRQVARVLAMAALLRRFKEIRSTVSWTSQLDSA
jgi:hypothetical protein